MNDSAVLFQDGDNKFYEPHPRTSRNKMKYLGDLNTRNTNNRKIWIIYF